MNGNQKLLDVMLFDHNYSQKSKDEDQKDNEQLYENSLDHNRDLDINKNEIARTSDPNEIDGHPSPILPGAQVDQLGQIEHTREQNRRSQDFQAYNNLR